MTFRNLDDADVKGKRVLVRVDLNVPMKNGNVADATRIERIGADHPRDRRQRRQGYPAVAFRTGPRDRDPQDSLEPVAAAVARIIGRPVAFAEDCVGEVAERAVARHEAGDILCLENTRFHHGEEKNDPDFVAAARPARRSLCQ